MWLRSGRGHVLVDLAGFKKQPPLSGADLNGKEAIIPDEPGDAPLLADIHRLLQTVSAQNASRFHARNSGTALSP